MEESRHDTSPDLDESVFDSTLTEHSTIGQEVLSPIHPIDESTSGSNFEAYHNDNHTPFPTDHTHDNIILYTFDPMTFPYPRYNGEPDAEAYVRSFLNVWNANHISQQLPKAEANASKITEFGLTLDRRAVRWNS